MNVSVHWKDFAIETAVQKANSLISALNTGNTNTYTPIIGCFPINHGWQHLFAHEMESEIS